MKNGVLYLSYNNYKGNVMRKIERIVNEERALELIKLNEKVEFIGLTITGKKAYKWTVEKRL